MTNNADDDSRMKNLELVIAHLQRDYDTLNGVVTEQALLIDRLKKGVATLTDRVQSLETRARDLPTVRIEDERPPHY